ncbi:AfsR/SARP family transcriptional regulator [Micromonospora sp. DT233]|uniref:AfsR/SARP family transcriptional regulator n=1 Tax=Micromonospora sp. DT233 TaxID=3393432 RepID=UPI003CEA9193
MRWARTTGYLLFLALLLAVPPVILVKVIGWPVNGWPDADEFRSWIKDPLTTQSIVGALTLLAWMVWLLVAYTVATRVLVQLRAGGRWLRRMPLPTPLQATATGMAGAAVFGVTTNSIATPVLEQSLVPTTGALDHQSAASTNGSGLARVVGDQAVNGVTVEGGWLPRTTAEQVVAVSALVWLRRRRHYQPQSPGASREDADLAALPATAAAVRASLADESDRADGTAPPSAPDAVTSGAPVLPPPLAGLPAEGVGLAGPGAPDAARGLLVSALLTATVNPDSVRVVATGTALRTLLPYTVTATGLEAAGLAVAETVEEAAVTAEALALSQLPTVLITETPSGQDIAIRVAGAGGATTVLGSWPPGSTWHVDETGHTRDQRGSKATRARLCVLDSVAAADLLAVVIHACPAAPTTRRSTPVQPRAPRPARPSAPIEIGHGSAACRLRVLGKPALSVDGRPITIRRNAALQALVFLAVRPEGASSRDLVEALWPGLPAHTVTGRLYTTFSSLRTTVRSAGGLALITHADDRYRLHSGHVDVDLWHLYDAVAHAATAITDQTTAWQDVIDLYTGELAAGHTWQWLDVPRETIRRQVIDAYAALATATPDPARVVSLLQAAIRVDPFNEDLHGRAVDALASVGEHTAADELREAHIRRLAQAGLEPRSHRRTSA